MKFLFFTNKPVRVRSINKIPPQLGHDSKTGKPVKKGCTKLSQKKSKYAYWGIMRLV